MNGLAMMLLLEAVPQDGPAGVEPRIQALLRAAEGSEVQPIYREIDRLADLGEPALAAVESAAKAAPGKAKGFLDLAAQEIRVMRDLKGSHPKLPRITMKSVDRNAAELLLDLKARTGIAMDLSDVLETENLADVAVDFSDASFPEALEHICKAANLGLYPDPDAIEFYTEDYEEAPAFFFRDCLFRLTDWSLKRVINFEDPPKDTLEATLEVFWDPRLQATGIWSFAAVTEAVDSKGKNLVPPKNPDVGEDPALVPTGDSLNDLELLAPHPEADGIALLRGYVTLALPKMRVLLALERVAEGGTAFKGGFQLRLVRSEPGRPGERKLDLEVTSPSLKESFLRTGRSTVEFVVKGGARVQARIEGYTVTEGKAQITAVLPGPRIVILAPGQPAPPEPPAIERVEVLLVTETLDRRVPFEFRDMKIR